MIHHGSTPRLARGYRGECAYAHDSQEHLETFVTAPQGHGLRMHVRPLRNTKTARIARSALSRTYAPAIVHEGVKIFNDITKNRH